MDEEGIPYVDARIFTNQFDTAYIFIAPMLSSFDLDADDYPVFRVWNVFDLGDPASWLMLMSFGIGNGFC